MPLVAKDPLRAPPRVRGKECIEEFVCWSRMQAEAGQPLDEIVARKERERLAGGGMFCWGVGNAPALLTRALAQLHHPVAAVFSIMKGRPKAIDLSPTRTLVWRRYINADGVERPLPPHVLVTSRGESKLGPKNKHFALMCWSDKPLAIEHGIPFDPGAYRNASGTGAPVGASQVTALLKRTSTSSLASPYEANLRARLVDGYWVRLADPLELTPEGAERVAIGLGKEEDWVTFVQSIRQDSEGPDSKCIPYGLLI